MLYKARNNVIIFFDDYSSVESEAKHKTTKGTGLKILTPKQKITNSTCTSKGKFIKMNLLNEIKQIVYSLYQSKEITKKSYNNTIKSIKV